jgi:UDP-glucose 4-epimerase
MLNTCFSSADDLNSIIHTYENRLEQERIVSEFHGLSTLSFLQFMLNNPKLLKNYWKWIIKKFIYISSSSVYGNNGTYRQHETSPLCPTNPYAVSKMAAESALKVQASEEPTELITVRPFTMYGDYMDFGEDALVISKFLTAWKRDEPLLLHGGGNQRRDFIHASDAVDGLLRILNHGSHGDVYNLGSGESVSIKEIADVISSKQIIVPDRRGAVQFTEADISRLKDLGFRPKVRILEWLTHCVNEYKLKELI